MDCRSTTLAWVQGLPSRTSEPSCTSESDWCSRKPHSKRKRRDPEEHWRAIYQKTQPDRSHTPAMRSGGLLVKRGFETCQMVRIVEDQLDGPIRNVVGRCRKYADGTRTVPERFRGPLQEKAFSKLDIDTERSDLYSLPPDEHLPNLRFDDVIRQVGKAQDAKDIKILDPNWCTDVNSAIVTAACAATGLPVGVVDEVNLQRARLVIDHALVLKLSENDILAEALLDERFPPLQGDSRNLWRKVRVNDHDALTKALESQKGSDTENYAWDRVKQDKRNDAESPRTWNPIPLARIERQPIAVPIQLMHVDLDDDDGQMALGLWTEAHIKRLIEIQASFGSGLQPRAADQITQKAVGKKRCFLPLLRTHGSVWYLDFGSGEWDPNANDDREVRIKLYQGIPLGDVATISGYFRVVSALAEIIIWAHEHYRASLESLINGVP